MKAEKVMTRAFDTYPEMFLDYDAMVENPAYDYQTRWFEVPSDWAESFIAEWASERNRNPDEWGDVYDWDDTWFMYEMADADGVIVKEWID